MPRVLLVLGQGPLAEQAFPGALQRRHHQFAGDADYVAIAQRMASDRPALLTLKRGLRLDADPGTAPDVVAPAHNLTVVPSASMDAAFSSHCIEHLYLDQAVPALREWRRVLKPDSFLLLVCPDLQAAAEMIAQDQLLEVTYAGNRPYDIVFSHQGLVAQGRTQGHSFMEHKRGDILSVMRT